MAGYKDLEIWNLAREIVIEIHTMTIQDLPKFEMYEVGSQIRRSSKSIKSNIVEGYGRRKYKQDFMKHLCYAIASRDETQDHLETLFETSSLMDKDKYETLLVKLQNLGKKLYHFEKSVMSKHNVEAG